ncbi:TonB-linked outer membrane protein, SusC/RagA family [Sinomicrobium oceani]|uniref:TonB-linked outer membrane protein, SusC/RagA family n=1 Tax=Sinomicrobium oceani TaxID=1150368 RepID=A0A1K1LLU5_9FLAO|nr:TonB-dependent receptor [Sinomicrobium oceani]SFW11860.1 TonB-linked outer membrane protein, SusC/RagA family [Sinomicrobium oceani]
MSKALLLFFLLTASFSLGAQTFSVSGNVTDAENNMPLPQVNIVVKGTTKGVVTDFDGNYIIESVSTGDVLVFSYIGFSTREVVLGTQQTVNISLEPNYENLNEIVVVGYGSQVKKEVTGAVSSIGAKTIEDLKPLNAAQALQGTTSGINVTPQGGAPGAEANIRIRGIATNRNNAPLIILDGFQYEGGLNSINPEDIENITVLKDAQAAIYGTIAANGVVLVTTKSGRKNQKPKIQYDAYTGIQETTRKLPVLNATEYAVLLNESYANAGQALPFPDISNLGKGTNWQDEVFRQAPVTNHNLSITGGEEKIHYSLGASHLDQEGIIGGDKADFRRSTARISLNADISEKLSVSTKLFYSRVKRHNINSFSLGSVLFNAANIAPVIDPSTANLDNTISLGNEVVNPLTQIDNTFNEYVTNRLSGTIQATLKYIRNMELQARFGFNTSNSRNREFAPIYNYGAGKIYTRTDNMVTLNKINDNDYTFDLFNTYSNVLADHHKVTFMLGMTAYKQYGEGLGGTRTGVQANSWKFADFNTATGSGDNQTNNSYAYDLRRLSYFTRLQYAFKNKYLFSAMIRRDASTLFAPEHRVAYFPSASAGWVVSEEDFFNDTGAVNFLKLRASYGVLGNDRIPTFGYLSLLNGEATYVLGNDQSLVNGYALGRLANPGIKWEEAKKFDVGLDLQLFDNKIEIIADYYRNVRENLLISNIPVSGILGTGAPGAEGPIVNAGTVENQGLEFAVNYNQTFDNGFNISAGYNIATLHNKATRVNNGTGYYEGGAFSVGQPMPARMEVGKPLGYFYGYRTDGIFQTQDEVETHPSQKALGAEARPGDIRYVDVNGDGVIDAKDRTDLGNPIPKVTMGLNLSLQYKGFDFSAYSFANLGNDIVRNYERDQPNVNKMNYRLNRWTGPGTGNSVPRVTTEPTTNHVFSDFFVEDGSFARIQSITLGYTIPDSFIKKSGLEKFRIYTKVDNVHTFTRYSGYDPTASSGDPIGSGIDYGFYPVPRTYIIGVNLQF